MSCFSQRAETRAHPLWRLAALGLVALCTACSTVELSRLNDASHLPLVDTPEALTDAAYLIRPGDDVDVKFLYTAELNELQKVRPDGYISLQLIDEVMAAGLSPKQLREQLMSRYQGQVKQSQLSVVVRSFAGNRAFIGGEVVASQAVPLEGGLSVLQAVQRAGGARPTADLGLTLLIRKGPQGQPIVYQLDLSDQAASRGQRDSLVALKPSDIVVLPRSRIANANLFVQQYIAELFLMRGMNFGYNINNEQKRETTTNIRTVP